MNLPGRLTYAHLPQVFEQLYETSSNGVLEVHTVGRCHRVVVREGWVIAVELDAAPQPFLFGELLVSTGALSSQEVQQAFSVYKKLADSIPRVGEWFVHTGIISSLERDQVLRSQVQQRLIWLSKQADKYGASLRFLVGPAANRFFQKARHSSTSKTSSSNEASCSSVDSAREQARSLLGINDHASSDLIRKAFRNAAARLHPDRHTQDSPEDRARMNAQLAELTAAYHLLCA